MTKMSKNNWLADQPEKLPDFIIGGAMKSGTTTLHAILNEHPEISIAQNELGFFDIDSITQHSDFNFFNPKNKQWTSQSFDKNRDLIWNWYYSQFPDNPKKFLGEDSTTYLASSMAPERIAMQSKPIKLIFLLRQPTKRTISNYSHLLKSGRATRTLEDTLRYHPESIINRSLYREQLERYYKHIPFDRIKVILFEDITHDTEKCIKDILRFIGADENLLPKEALNTHSNKTKMPKSVRLQLIRNRLLRYFGNYRYSKFLPVKPTFQSEISLAHRIINKCHNSINPKREEYSLKVNESTIDYLDNFFKIELQGLDDLIKQDVFKTWFKQ